MRVSLQLWQRQGWLRKVHAYVGFEQSISKLAKLACICAYITSSHPLDHGHSAAESPIILGLTFSKGLQGQLPPSETAGAAAGKVY